MREKGLPKMVFKESDFTEQAREAIASSQNLLREYRHSQWDVEHVLLALLQLTQGVPSRILSPRRLASTLSSIRLLPRNKEPVCQAANRCWACAPGGVTSIFPDMDGIDHA